MTMDINGCGVSFWGLLGQEGGMIITYNYNGMQWILDDLSRICCDQTLGTMASASEENSASISGQCVAM